MSDVSMTVVILTYNEEKHIERCIRSLRLVASKIHVVDSFSTDRTVKLAKSLGAEVMQRAFVNHAEQFQWALDNAHGCGRVPGA
jgi:glycosyltransferase involved in cell wall biosynthesis